MNQLKNICDNFSHGLLGHPVYIQWCAKKIAGSTQQSYFVEDDKYRKSFFVHSPYIIEYTNIIIDS